MAEEINQNHPNPKFHTSDIFESLGSDINTPKSNLLAGFQHRTTDINPSEIKNLGNIFKPNMATNTATNTISKTTGGIAGLEVQTNILTAAFAALSEQLKGIKFPNVEDMGKKMREWLQPILQQQASKPGGLTGTNFNSLINGLKNLTFGQTKVGKPDSKQTPKVPVSGVGTIAAVEESLSKVFSKFNLVGAGLVGLNDIFQNFRAEALAQQKTNSKYLMFNGSILNAELGFSMGQFNRNREISAKVGPSAIELINRNNIMENSFVKFDIMMQTIMNRLGSFKSSAATAFANNVLTPISNGVLGVDNFLNNLDAGGVVNAQGNKEPNFARAGAVIAKKIGLSQKFNGPLGGALAGLPAAFQSVSMMALGARLGSPLGVPGQIAGGIVGLGLSVAGINFAGKNDKLGQLISYSVTGGVVGAGIGAVVGGGLGFFVPWFGGPLAGAWLGARIGYGVGTFAGGLLGAFAPTPAQAAKDAQDKAITDQQPWVRFIASCANSADIIPKRVVPPRVPHIPRRP